MGKLLTVRVPDDVFAELTSRAGPRGRSAMVTEALRAHLGQVKPVLQSKPTRVAKPITPLAAFVAWKKNPQDAGLKRALMALLPKDPSQARVTLDQLGVQALEASL